MRKVLIIGALLAAAGSFAAAYASEDRSRPVQEGSQPTAQLESIGKDRECTGAARDDRSHESDERYREARREHDDDERRSSLPRTVEPAKCRLYAGYLSCDRLFAHPERLRAFADIY